MRRMSIRQRCVKARLGGCHLPAFEKRVYVLQRPVILSLLHHTIKEISQRGTYRKTRWGPLDDVHIFKADALPDQDIFRHLTHYCYGSIVDRLPK